MSRYSRTQRIVDEPWRVNEVSILLRKVKENTSVEELMRIHRRSKDSIKTKLNHLASDYYFTNGELFKQIQTLTGINEQEFLVKRELAIGMTKTLDTPETPRKQLKSESTPLISEITEARLIQGGSIQGGSIQDEPTEDEQIHICTSIALKILSTIIDSSLILKSTIKTQKSEA
jgi:hypothetical protein